MLILCLIILIDFADGHLVVAVACDDDGGLLQGGGRVDLHEGELGLFLLETP
jgi:hypothetical protein